MSSINNEFLMCADNFTIPDAIKKSPGVSVGDLTVHSILLSTDLSYIQNMNTDAVMAIHPFEASKELNRNILKFSDKSVLCSIGGGFRGRHSAGVLAKDAAEAGASGLVITKPTTPEVVRYIRQYSTGNLIYTVIHDGENISALIDAGVDMFNVSTGETTAVTVGNIRSSFPDIPIIANGGPFDSTIYETIKMGADAIVYNPPTATEVLRNIFDKYRRGKAL